MKQEHVFQWLAGSDYGFVNSPAHSRVLITNQQMLIRGDKSDATRLQS